VEGQLLEILRCPLCGERLQEDGSQLACSGCQRTFERDGDVPLLFHDDLPGAKKKKREMDGWVEKARCSSDQRVTYAVLTDAGLAKISAAREAHHRDTEELFGAKFTDDELETLDGLLKRLPLADTACQA
jgi:uncharacterized protein YbaR (Trm112 family)